MTGRERKEYTRITKLDIKIRVYVYIFFFIYAKLNKRDIDLDGGNGGISLRCTRNEHNPAKTWKR